MKDANDKSTVDAFCPNKPTRGPRPSGKAKTGAQRQKAYRARQKLRLAQLEALLANLET